MGPLTTALALVTLSKVGALSTAELGDGCRFLRSVQLSDGGFAGRPFSSTADLSTTTIAWAALSLSSESADRSAAASARQAVQLQGGLDAVCGLSDRGDIAPAVACLAGLLEPERVKTVPLALVLVPRLLELCSRRVVFYGLTTMLSCSLIVRARAEQSPANSWRQLVRQRETARAIELLTLYQNRNGSLMNVVYHTALLVSALAAAGLPSTDARLSSAVAFLRSRATRDGDKLFFDVYGTDVWSTASYLRVLLVSGLARSSEPVTRAVEWLLAEQCRIPHPSLSNPQPHAPRTGGWGFQSAEDRYPDCDTTSTVVDALARALLPDALDTTCLPARLAPRACAAIAAGRAWLMAMQNPDGGWPSFFWGHPTKRPGPIMLRPPRFDFARLSWRDLSGWVRALAESAEQVSDPATEDVTSRVLTALARSGSRTEDPEIERAMQFLQAQQCPSGAFWGRWKVNYLPVTACVVVALAALGSDLRHDVPRRALSWMRSCQNEDGGFGEGIGSYRDPSLAGVGSSNAPVSGSVLLALVEARSRRAAARAARHLLDTQQEDGAWPNRDCVAPLVPPDLFYFYAGAARYIPLEALAAYRRLLDTDEDQS